MLTFDDLLTGFDQTGITDNDLVMIHSSYKSFGGVVGGANAVVDAINELVVPRGGATFWPCYTVDAWCNRRYFDHDETPGEMGIIPEVARLKDGARRTRHPIHSFAIHGPWRDAFRFDNVESFSPRGPFGLFHRENGLVISIGVYWDDTISFVHYVEQQAGALFRRLKNFAGMYVSGGEADLRTVRMSVRKTKKYITHVAPLYDEVLVPDGVVKQIQIGGATVSYFRCQDYYDAVFPLVTDNPELFHYIKEWKKPAEPARKTNGMPSWWRSEFQTSSEMAGWEKLAEDYLYETRRRFGGE